MCEISSNINPGTLEYQSISFFHKIHLFNVIDIPGLDNSDSNNKNIEHNDLRLSGSMKNAIINYMNAFSTRRNFLEHVIVVNTYANKHSKDFKDFY